MMKVLVINCGSSSLKYQLIDMETESVLAKGCLRGSKKSVFLPFVLDKDAKVGYDREDRQREAL